MRVEVSAPGKAILVGEHAAVYGRPAIVAAIDRRLKARIEDGSGDGVELDLPQVGVNETLPWDVLRAYTAERLAAWRAYRGRPTPETFAGLRGDDPSHVVKVALGEADAWLGGAAQDTGGAAPPIRVRVDSEIPVGSGFGSSAAAALAVLAAYLGFRGADHDAGDLRRLALDVERRQHGLPSGVDGATVLAGGLLWAEREPGGALVTEPLGTADELLGRIRVYDSGPPAESTGAVVAAVRQRRDDDPVGVDAILGRMEAASHELRAELDAPGPRAVALLRRFQRCLEELGVVPSAVRAIVRRVEAEGGAAKVSGAGSLAGPGAGSLLVYHPEPERIDRWAFLAPLTALDLRLGASGLRRENSES